MVFTKSNLYTYKIEYCLKEHMIALTMMMQRINAMLSCFLTILHNIVLSSYQIPLELLSLATFCAIFWIYGFKFCTVYDGLNWIKRIVHKIDSRVISEGFKVSDAEIIELILEIGGF